MREDREEKSQGSEEERKEDGKEEDWQEREADPTLRIPRSGALPAPPRTALESPALFWPFQNHFRLIEF